MYRFALSVLGCALLSLSTSRPVDAGLAGYWSFDDGSGTSVADHSVHGNAGTLAGATLPQWIAGPSGQPDDYALSFSGAGNPADAPHVALGNLDALKIAGNQTISMWLSPDDFDARRNPYAKEYGGSGTITQEMNGNLSYYFGGSGDNAAPWEGHGSNGAVDLGTWNHVAVVRDLDEGKVRWYLNGNMTREASTTFTPPGGANPVVPGNLPAYIGRGYTSNYAGDIDDVAIWDEALTAQALDWIREGTFAANELPRQLPVVEYTYDSNVPNAHSDYYNDEGKDPDEDYDWDNPTGDLTDGVFVGDDGASKPFPDDTLVGWNTNTSASLTFDLGDVMGVDYVVLGGHNYHSFSNDVPDDVDLLFSTDGVNFSSPMHFETPFSDEFHAELILELPETMRASHVRLSFDGGTVYGNGKYLLDEVQFFQNVPEPGTIVLLLLGLVGLCLPRRRRPSAQ
jgi:hypothetical protein